MLRNILLIRAPSNLGLRPLAPGHEPGTWRAPEVLTQAGLVEVLSLSHIIDLDRPAYAPLPDAGSGLLNGAAVKAFNVKLADVIEALNNDPSALPVIVGGDCSILLGALAGRRRCGPLSLVHIDGHSDFRHPGNDDAAAVPGAVAGMDLALATGRGERLLTEWPLVVAPLVPDEQVVQIGERESRDADFPWPDINDTAITRIDVFTVHDLGLAEVIARTLAALGKQPDWPFWVHLDVEVLDQSVMPAVDSPGSPGIDEGDLVRLLRALVNQRLCSGITVTIYDPDLDPHREHAARLVALLRCVFMP
ncbi:arginase family protein [Microvirga sp. CF3016]|uniref:arginase family protein n=1 Tax=Microvirga sp. CF3016 TaxID=3110181 RepID=UPI002E75B5C3|nr:arginase family protein [Microvirga sp. CF3016]MEE1612677.1 arginase family protein [Microvirga sp. CF3016]